MPLLIKNQIRKKGEKPNQILRKEREREREDRNEKCQTKTKEKKTKKQNWKLMVI